MDIKVYGGCEQIGGNCVEIASARARIICDIGMPLVDLPQWSLDDFNSPLMRQELINSGVLPNVSGLYYWDKPEVDAVIFSHSHIDHVGWAFLVHPEIKLLMSPLTYNLLVNRMDVLQGKGNGIPNAHFYESEEVMHVKDIDIIAFNLNHSASDAQAFLFACDGTNILYTGDFRNHGRNPEALETMLQQLPTEIDALIIEGTNIGRLASQARTEEELEQEIYDYCKKTAGIVLGIAATQNKDRIHSFYNAAIRAERQLVIDPYQAHILDIMENANWCKIKEGLRVCYTYKTSKALADAGKEKILYKYKGMKVSKEDLRRNPHKYMFLIRSSMDKEIDALELNQDSLCIYSLWQGYKNSDGSSRIIEKCQKKQVNIVDIHTSGHADAKTLNSVIERIAPRHVIPIHTLQGEGFKDFCDFVTVPTKDGRIVINNSEIDMF